MKWIILILVLGSDFILLAALCCIWWFFTPILAIFLTFPTYFAWRKTGGISNWKISTIKNFLKNWESEDKHICGSCTNKKCPRAGSETWNRVAHGPTTDCMRYYPGGTIRGVIFAPLYWLADWLSRLGE